MTARRRAVNQMLEALRADLLVAPAEPVVAAHLEMMRLERQLLAPAPASRSRARVTFTRTHRRTRPAVTHPRRFVCLFAAISMVFASAGLDAVGALPKPLQHLSNSIKRTIGVKGPSHDTGAGALPSSGARRVAAGPVAGAPSADAPTATDAGSSGSTTATGATPSSSAAPTPDAPVSTSAPTASGTTADGPTGSPAPVPTPVQPKPPKKNMPGGGGPPPGFPTDWQARAVAAATGQLQTCAQSTVLAPAGCPQVATTADAPDSVQWTVINEPLGDAVAIATPVPGVAGAAATTLVSVYGRFQMNGSYTVAGATASHSVYSGGIAKATMSWDGTAFPAVTFTSGSVAGQLPIGVHVPLFVRPAAVTDAAAVSAVQAAWTLAGTALPGAVVAFDTAHGNFTVTGTYTIAPSDPGAPPVTSTYSATLSYDGTQLHVIDIAGS